MTPKIPLKILCLEDSPGDAEIIRRVVSGAGFALTFDVTKTEVEFTELLTNRQYDVILADFTLPGFDGFEAVRIAQRLCPQIPLISVSGAIGEEIATELIKCGAAEYILKDHIIRLPAAIQRARDEVKAKEARQKADREILRLSRTYAMLSNINKLIVRERDRQRIFEEACRIVVESGKLMLCWIGLVDETTRTIEPAAHAGASNGCLDNLHLSLEGNGPTGTAGREARMAICNDIYNDPRMSLWKEQARALGFRSSSAFPLFCAGTVVGTINIYSDEVNYFDADVIDLLQGLAMDISFAMEKLENDKKRKQSEEEARKLSRAVEQSPVSVVITNMHGAIEYVNPRFTETTGYLPDEVIGQNPRLLKSGGTTPDEYARMWKLIMAGKQWHGDFLNKKKNGTMYWESASISPIFNEHGIITHFLAVKEDITERKRTEEALKTSEERYRMLIRNQGEGISLSDLDGKFMFTNPAAEAVFQVPPGTLRGRNWREFVVPEHVCTIEKENDSQTLGGRSTYEIDITTACGERRNLLVTAIKQSDKKGMYAGTFSVFRDITERKQMEEKLRISEEYYRMLVDATPEAIIKVDRQGAIKFVSAKVYDVFAIPADQDVLGRSFLDWVDPEDLPLAAKRFQVIYTQKEKADIGVYRLLKNNNTPFWGEISTSHLLDRHGEVAGLLMLCRDVTEKIRLEQELIQSQKMQSLGRLAGGIAHDFNNILGIILAYTSMLGKAGITQEKASERLSGLENAVQRGTELVKQILTFARKTDVLTERLSLVDLVHEHLGMLKQTFPKTIVFTEATAEGIPAITADRTQIHQALLNLCVNARDAMPGGGTIAVAIGVRPRELLEARFPSADRDQYVEIAITDTGAGIPDATRAKIFEPFFTTKDVGKGTGLGLSVVFGVMEAHHGFVDVESTLGTGTTFRLYFPVTAEADAPAVSVCRDESIAMGGTETLLLVEDERYLLEIFRLELEAQGYRVYTAYDGIQAVEEYKKHRDEISLLLTDVGLPGMPGTDVLRKIREMTPDVRCIFMSGFFSPEVREDIAAIGVYTMLQKPCTPNAMLKKIREVLNPAHINE